MPPLTLVQKRALLAAMNNSQKLEKEYTKAVNNFWAINTFRGPAAPVRAAEQKIADASRKWHRSRALLKRLENKLGVNGHTANYGAIELGVISNLVTKHAPKLKEKRWLKGLEAEKKRALANFALWSAPNAFRESPVRMPSPLRKMPRPPRARGPSPRSPATLARQVNLGIMGGARRAHGPRNNTHVTWVRRNNGKINRFKTLTNLNLSLTNAQKNALEQMSENQAVNTIRRLARQR